MERRKVRIRGVIPMKKIPLTNGLFATVDDEDFEWLNQYRWFALDKVVRGKRATYAARVDPKSGKAIFMHDEIMQHVAQR